MMWSRAALLGDNPSRTEPGVIYAGFGRRAFALAVDVTLALGVHFAVVRYGYSQPIAIAGAWILLSWFLSIAYVIVFHAQWGRTIGKMLSGIKVRRLDGGAIDYREAILRSSVDILLTMGRAVALVAALASWTNPPWPSLDALEKIKLLFVNNPTASVLDELGQVWIWSELVVLLLNEKRRAIHDYIAGTVIVVE